MSASWALFGIVHLRCPTRSYSEDAIFSLDKRHKTKLQFCSAIWSSVIFYHAIADIQRFTFDVYVINNPNLYSFTTWNGKQDGCSFIGHQTLQSVKHFLIFGHSIVPVSCESKCREHGGNGQ